MTDPLDALAAPIVPIAPAPAFAIELRRRLERELSRQAGAGQEEHVEQEKEESMPDALLHNQVSRNGTRHGDVSYVTLALPDAAAGRRFYSGVLGWSFGPGAVETQGNQAAEVVPQVGLWPGSAWREGIHAGAILSWRVDDLTTAVERVRRAGGTATDPEQLPYGLQSECTDGNGLRFWLHELPPPVGAAGRNGEHEGDVSYVVLRVADLDRGSTTLRRRARLVVLARHHRRARRGSLADDRDEQGITRGDPLLPRRRHRPFRRAGAGGRRPGGPGRFAALRTRIALRGRPGGRVLPPPVLTTSSAPWNPAGAEKNELSATTLEPPCARTYRVE